jgi:hypothetical protein
MDLIAVADTAMIFAPGRFLGISDEIDARDMMLLVAGFSNGTKLLLRVCN